MIEWINEKIYFIIILYFREDWQPLLRVSHYMYRTAHRSPWDTLTMLCQAGHAGFIPIRLCTLSVTLTTEEAVTSSKWHATSLRTSTIGGSLNTQTGRGFTSTFNFIDCHFISVCTCLPVFGSGLSLSLIFIHSFSQYTFSQYTFSQYTFSPEDGFWCCLLITNKVNWRLYYFHWLVMCRRPSGVVC